VGRYENIIVVSPDCTKEEEEELIKRVRANLEKFGSTILKMDDWGIRKLAYVIKKKDKGHYFFFLVDVDEANMANINKFYKTLDLVLRHILVRVDDDAKGLEKSPDHVIFDELEGEFSS
jgi:small subunit ribosomal protein S6